MNFFLINSNRNSIHLKNQKLIAIQIRIHHQFEFINAYSNSNSNSIFNSLINSIICWKSEFKINILRIPYLAAVDLTMVNRNVSWSGDLRVSVFSSKVLFILFYSYKWSWILKGRSLGLWTTIFGLILNLFFSMHVLYLYSRKRGRLIFKDLRYPCSCSFQKKIQNSVFRF